MALRGVTFDGHAYVDSAIAAGAVLVVVERGRVPHGESADVVEVGDTLSALGALAGAHLASWRRAHPLSRVVAVTGSAGKTTTKELCAALLGRVGPCHRTRGNLNNRVGVPSVLFGIEPHHAFAVVELGMSLPGEIATLGAMVEPDMAVLTNVGLAHAGGVGGSLQDVAREKGALFERIRPGGVAVANSDDSSVAGELRRASQARVVTFGSGRARETMLFRLAVPSTSTVRSSPCVAQVGDQCDVRLRLVGEAAAVDFVAALAAAESATGTVLDEDRVREAVLDVAPVEGRLQLRHLERGIRVLDDSYNANPTSVRASLDALVELARGRRVAVLGEMKESVPPRLKSMTRLARP